MHKNGRDRFQFILSETHRYLSIYSHFHHDDKSYLSNFNLNYAAYDICFGTKT